MPVAPMSPLAAILAALGLFSLIAASHRPDRSRIGAGSEPGARRSRRDPREAERQAEDEAVDTAARVIGLALLSLAAAMVWP